jgi:hypothetical protein
MTGVCRQTVWRKIQQGLLLTVDVCGQQMIPATELVRLGLRGDPQSQS